MTVTVIQESITPYRRPFFERLGATPDLNLRLAFTSGEAPPALASDRVSAASLGPLRWSRGLGAIWSQSDVVVVPLDVHWPHRLIRARFSRRTGVVWWGHGLGRRRLGASLRRLALRPSHAFVLYDEQPTATLRAAGVRDEAMFVAHNTLDVPNAGVLLDVTRDQFLFVGRIQERKRLQLAIRAFAAADLDPSIGFTLLGDGDTSALQLLAADQGVSDRVRFVAGTRDPAVLGAEFSRSLAYVSPGALGLGALHSFAYGVPVVVAEGSGHGPEASNVRHGETGVWTQATVDALAGGLEQLSDPAASHTFGTRAFAHYRDHRSPEAMTAVFTDAIRWAHRAATPRATTPASTSPIHTSS